MQQETYIQTLLIADTCKRRAVDSNVTPREIFDNVCRQSEPMAAEQVTFTKMEGVIYKTRRLSLPALPKSILEADTRIRNSRYLTVKGEVFYRGLVEGTEDGSALIFASREQLEVLSEAREIFFDATFKVVPTLFYQLFTIFATHADETFPVLYALMTRKSFSVYRALFAKMKELVPTCNPSNAMADFEEASGAAIREIFGNVVLNGCWFHFAQAVMKRVQKLGLKVVYGNNKAVTDIVHCIFGLPLLPATEINLAVQDIRGTIPNNSTESQQLQQLVAYVQRQWIDRQSVGPDRLSVHDNKYRTNNVLESYHADLRRRIKVAHPNFFGFLGHIQHVTIDEMTDIHRLDNGLNIRRPKKKKYLHNDSRIKTAIEKFDSGAYTRLQFLSAVSHSMGAHTAALEAGAATAEDEEENDDQITVTNNNLQVETELNENEDKCVVCYITPRSGVALVPCGHSRFCTPCAERVLALNRGCPICRANITMVLRIFL